MHRGGVSSLAVRAADQKSGGASDAECLRKHLRHFLEVEVRLCLPLYLHDSFTHLPDCHDYLHVYKQLDMENGVKFR